MSNIVLWLVGGALTGWLIGRTIGADRWAGLAVDALVGAGGAVMAGWYIPALVGMGPVDPGDFSLPAFAAALLGATFLLAVFGLVRRVMPHHVR
jgi:uncharacterized membrane protein YeaQ/YmgE (transglycosylase-associated protein family)